MCPTELYLHDNIESKSILIKTSLLSLLQYIKLKLNKRDKLCNVPWRLNTQGSKFEGYGLSFEKKSPSQRCCSRNCQFRCFSSSQGCIWHSQAEVVSQGQQVQIPRRFRNQGLNCTWKWMENWRSLCTICTLWFVSEMWICKQAAAYCN